MGGCVMGRSMKKRHRQAIDRLADVSVSHAIGARMYLDKPGFNVDAFRDFCAHARLPVQSVFFAKGAAGDYTAAIKIVRMMFPLAEWCIDSGGADISLGDIEVENENSGNPALAMVKCALDLIIQLCEEKP